MRKEGTGPEVSPMLAYLMLLNFMDWSIKKHLFQATEQDGCREYATF